VFTPNISLISTYVRVLHFYWPRALNFLDLALVVHIHRSHGCRSSLSVLTLQINFTFLHHSSDGGFCRILTITRHFVETFRMYNLEQYDQFSSLSITVYELILTYIIITPYEFNATVFHLCALVTNSTFVFYTFSLTILKIRSRLQQELIISPGQLTSHCTTLYTIYIA
jgi:hypothetical protein